MTKREAPIMVADGPWDVPTVYALRHVPSGEPLSPHLADAIRASARRIERAAQQRAESRANED